MQTTPPHSHEERRRSAARRSKKYVDESDEEDDDEGEVRISRRAQRWASQRIKFLKELAAVRRSLALVALALFSTLTQYLRIRMRKEWAPRPRRPRSTFGSFRRICLVSKSKPAVLSLQMKRRADLTLTAYSH